MHEPPQTLSPITASERIIALDVLRGVAILGIFFVNIAFFADSMTVAIDLSLLADAPASEQLAAAFVRVFAEFKFISLFSLLFGIGLVVQLNRARERGSELGTTYIRRLLVLGVIGLVHGLLIWYGDVLFMYAIGGLVLFLLRGASASVLATLAAICLFIGGGLFSCMSGLGALTADMRYSDTNTDASNEQLPADDSPQAAQAARDDMRMVRWREAWDRWGDAGYDITHEAWHETETIAYKQGPMSATIITRSVGYAGHLIAGGIFAGFGLRVLGMFLLGAALMKWSFFDASKRRLHLYLFFAGLALGLALEGAVAYLYHFENYELSWLTFIADTVHYFASMVLMFGYVGGICTLVHAGALRWLQSAIGAVGRMALTNYLLQSVIATFIMYWWGLALFGEFNRAQQLMLVAGIYVSQVIFSLLWLRLFRFGPMEWLWRTLAYWKWQPMLRAS